MHERSRLAAFAGTLGERLDESREVRPARSLARALLSDREGGRRHAGVAHQTLGHRLVETGCKRERVREQVRLIEQLAERGHLRLARAALHPFGNGEHEIEALASDKPSGKGLSATDADRLAAERLDRARQRVDGGHTIELGHLLLGEAEHAIVVAEIVDEGDAH